MRLQCIVWGCGLNSMEIKFSWGDGRNWGEGEDWPRSQSSHWIGGDSCRILVDDCRMEASRAVTPSSFAHFLHRRFMKPVVCARDCRRPWGHSSEFTRGSGCSGSGHDKGEAHVWARWKHTDLEVVTEVGALGRCCHQSPAGLVTGSCSLIWLCCTQQTHNTMCPAQF